MENLLQKEPGINLVYSINEPAAAGGYQALKAAGKEKSVTIVSVDGGCPGVENVKAGVIGATSQQYPLLMASMGLEAIVAFAERVVPDGATGEHAGQTGKQHTYYISDALFATPPIAVQQTKFEIINMAEIAMDNVKIALECARTLDFSRKAEFDQNEEELNFLNQELARYMAKLFGEQLSESDRNYLSHALHSISDLERVGDYSTNIVEYAEKLAENDRGFSSDAQGEIAMLEDFIEKLYTHVMHAYVMKDQESYDNAKAAEAAIDLITEQMAQNHVGRVAAGVCSPEVGAHYIGLISDAERIGDHFYNLTKARRGFQP
jgi:Na+/phosphate symporter